MRNQFIWSKTLIIAYGDLEKIGYTQRAAAIFSQFSARG
jgi:hypothetical protein